MTNDEAVLVAKVLSEVDGGCEVCSHDAAVNMAGRFPDHPWVAMVGALRDRVLDDGNWRLPTGYSRKAMGL